jgi:hypothetical protein
MPAAPSMPVAPPVAPPVTPPVTTSANQPAFKVMIKRSRWTLGCASFSYRSLSIGSAGLSRRPGMGTGDDCHWTALAWQIANAVPFAVRPILPYEAASWCSFVMLSSGGWMILTLGLRREWGFIGRCSRGLD